LILARARTLAFGVSTHTQAPPGHERYFEELEEILTRGGPPDREAIADLRRRYDTEQLTP
jgi:hypothetical protein